MDQSRRIELAEKKSRHGLTEAETTEFNRLQEEFFAQFDQQHSSRLDKFEERLKRIYGDET